MIRFFEVFVVAVFGFATGTNSKKNTVYLNRISFGRFL